MNSSDGQRIQDAAHAGLQASARLRLRFWAHAAENGNDAAQALEVVDGYAGSTPAVQHVVALSRTAAAGTTPRGRLTAYRLGLSEVKKGVAGSTCALAGLACRMFDAVTLVAPPPSASALLDVVATSAASDATVHPTAENVAQQRALQAAQAMLAAGVGGRHALELAHDDRLSSAAMLARTALDEGANVGDGAKVHMAAVRSMAAWSDDPKTAAHVQRGRELESLLPALGAYGATGGTEVSAERAALYALVLQDVAADADPSSASALTFARALLERIDAKSEAATRVREWALHALISAPQRKDPRVGRWMWLGWDVGRLQPPARAHAYVAIMQALEQGQDPTVPRRLAVLGSALEKVTYRADEDADLVLKLALDCTRDAGEKAALGLLRRVCTDGGGAMPPTVVVPGPGAAASSAALAVGTGSASVGTGSASAGTSAASAGTAGPTAAPTVPPRAPSVVAALGFLGGRPSLGLADVAGAAARVMAVTPDAPSGEKLAAGLRAAAGIQSLALESDDRDRAVQASFIALCGGLACETDASRTAMVSNGLSMMAGALPPGVKGLNTLALRMAGSASTFAGKLAVARAAFAQGVLLQPAGVARDRYTQVGALADVEDPLIHASPNRVWFHAAASLALLQDLARRDGDAARSVAAAATVLFDAPWAHASYLQAVGGVAVTALRTEAARSGDILTEDILARLDVARAQTAGDAEADVRVLGEALRTACAQGRDGMERALLAAARRPDEEAPRIEQAEDFITIGGVRVARAGRLLPTEAGATGVTREAAVGVNGVNMDVACGVSGAAYSVSGAASGVSGDASPSGSASVSNSSSVSGAAAHDPSLAGAPPASASPAAAPDFLLTTPPPWPADLPTASAAAEVQWDSHRNDGDARAWNPLSGETSGTSQRHGGAAAVYNPLTRKVETFTRSRGGLAVVFNPRTRAMEHRELHKGGCAGAFDPQQGRVVWAEASKAGVAAVYDPGLGRVMTDVTRNKGNAGFYDAARGQVSFDSARFSGRSVVSTDPAAATLQAASFPGWNEDEW